MRIVRFAPLSVLILAAGCASAPATATSGGEMMEPTPRPAAEPVATVATFTADQAQRGQDQFVESCSECHSSSEFRGRQFEFSWGRRTVGDFYRHVFDNMPEDAPGSLTPQQYVDVVAYILDLNGFRPGDSELPPDETVLAGFSLTPPAS